MRRLLAAVAIGAVLATGWLVTAGAGGGGNTYRVDAIFDNASFLIPGQDVKIAGAKVGVVDDVTLTRDNKARIQMKIEEGFAPFRSDADCTVQPQSLIGEKFIQCTPGTPRGNPLRATAEEAPTVPLTNTHSPVDLDLVFSTFRRPTNERLALIINELGGGLAGRGEDLNLLIRRANPALQEANRVLRIVDRDRRKLRSLIHASDRVVGELAKRSEDVGDFIAQGAGAATAAAERRQQIEDAVEDLPELLAEAQPSLDNLERLARAGTPILADLQASAPQVRRLARDAKPLADAARPALTRLGTASRTGQRALRAVRPVVGQLRAFAAAAKPTGALVDELFKSLRARGVVEGLQSFTYYAALATSRFDTYSHTLPAHLLASDCAEYRTTPLPQCNAHFATGGGAPAKRPVRSKPKAERPAAKAPAPAAPKPAAPAPAKPEPRLPDVPLLDDLLDKLPPLPGGADEKAKEALDDLLDALGKPGSDGKRPQADGIKSILDYLLR